MDVFERKIGDIANSSPNSAATTFFVSFANLKSRVLSHHPSDDRVMARTEARAIARASHGNITVLGHLKSYLLYNQ